MDSRVRTCIIQFLLQVLHICELIIFAIKLVKLESEDAVEYWMCFWSATVILESGVT